MATKKLDPKMTCRGKCLLAPRSAPGGPIPPAAQRTQAASVLRATRPMARSRGLRPPSTERPARSVFLDADGRNRPRILTRAALPC